MKRVILFTIILASFASCKKVNNNAVNTDTDNRVFRVVASSDKIFKIQISQFKVNGSTTDTIKYAIFDGNFDVNQGFTPAIGDKVNVKAITATGSFLHVNIVYKGNNIGPGANVETTEGITSDFTYDVKD